MKERPEWHCIKRVFAGEAWQAEVPERDWEQSLGFQPGDRENGKRAP